MSKKVKVLNLENLRDHETWVHAFYFSEHVPSPLGKKPVWPEWLKPREDGDIPTEETDHVPKM